MDINRLDFGQDSAESERENLRYIFLSTSFYKQLRTSKKWLVLGRKGSGKTATCLMFFDQIKTQHNVSLLSPKSLSAAKSALLDKGSVNSGDAATQKWKFVFLLEASRYIVHLAYKEFGGKYSTWAEPLQKIRAFLIDNDESNANKLDKALRFIRSINKIAISAFKIEGSIEIDKQAQDGSSLSDDIDIFLSVIQDAVKLIKNETIYFLVDQVDDLWDSTEEGQNLIIGLLKASKEINDNLELVKIIVFLRSDIFSYLHFDNSDHFRSHTESIEWDVDSLKRLIALRIHKSTGIRGGVDELWTSVFPSTIGEENSFNFIAQYTLMRPRDLIQLCNICKDYALKNNSDRITSTDILDAIKKYSGWKLEDLVSEYFVQYPFLEKVFLGVFYASPNYEISRDKFVKLFEAYKKELIKQYGSKYFEPLDILLQVLYGIGFLGVVHQKKVLYEVLGDKVVLPHANLFHVHRAFRNGLRIPEAELDFDKYFTKIVITPDNAERIYGDGAIVQGDVSKAIGHGGINISGTVSGNVVILLPETPKFFRRSSLTSLAWLPSFGADGYIVQESDEPSFTESKEYYKGDQTSCNITARSTSKYYRVCAFNRDGNSPWSVIVTVKQ